MPPSTATESKTIDRELSWLEFNRRVLDQAQRPDHPLLERVKFLAITSSNLDEFFQVRIGSLQFLLAERLVTGDAQIESLRSRLDELKGCVREFYEQQYDVLLDALEPALREQGICRIGEADLTSSQKSFLHRQFEELVSSVISPLSIDEAKPFPLLAGAPLCLCVALRGEGTLARAAAKPSSDEGTAASPVRYVVISLGRSLNRFWSLPSESGFHYVLLETIVSLFVRSLFPGETVDECVAFRVTRNADFEVDEFGVGDLLQEIEQLLEERKVSRCVRLEIDQSASPAMRQFLQRSLEIDDADFYPCRGPIGLASLMRLTQVQGRANLKDDPWPPQPSPDFPSGGDIFEIIGQRDRMLFHPYQTFDPVVELIQRAAADRDVLAIKQTLYRTARDSDIVRALSDAARSGKNVTAVVELKARFDEARNIAWAKQLEAAGVDVVYGIRGLKVHAKLCVVVRREPTGIRRYIHIGTGNYNEVTAKLYSDLSFFTADPQIADDAVKVFNAITGFSAPQPLQKLVMAPLTFRERIVELIESETRAARAGRPSRIEIKINSLVDMPIIEALYAAAQAGVHIDINVRGVCCLRPGVPGLSENIRVISVVDRFLEHARIYRFYHNGDDIMLIGSADLMTRNLDRRVEVLVPIDDPQCKAELQMVLDCFFNPQAISYQLDNSGRYRLQSTGKKSQAYRCQERLYQTYRDRYEDGLNPRTKIFRPVRGE